MKIKKFHIFYGGYFEEKWEVTWREKEIRFSHYETCPENYSTVDYESRLPEYIQSLSTITRYWLPEYSTDICDGTQWEIDIRVDKHKFTFYGSNDYPGNFEEFIRATRIFLNDSTFAKTHDADNEE